MSVCFREKVKISMGESEKVRMWAKKERNSVCKCVCELMCVWERELEREGLFLRYEKYVENR